ncbi:hypothetical protein GOV11_02090 [Candidatus Woesearchaeota archaeon]|nr:hypothetical protein [Candidatus Woesearchaeota archaeon]
MWRPGEALMAEIKILTKKPMTFKGPFRVDEFCGLIRRFAKERNYFMVEENNQEDVLPDGNQIVMDVNLSKQLSDYAKGVIDVHIHMHGCTDKVLEIEGQKQKCQVGTIDVECVAKMESDYRNRYENKGFSFLFRTISDKFIRRDITHQQNDSCTKDCTDLAGELKSYLNMHRFKLDDREKMSEPEEKA